MKRILWLSLSVLLALGAAGQTQQGYVKTKGRKGNNGAVVPGKRIVGATVQVKGSNAVLTNANGVFSFPIPSSKFYIQNVKKQGYVPADPELLTKQYVFSTNPLILVLETPEQQTDDKLASERKIRRTLQRQLQQREDEIEDLKKQNKLTREQYQQALQQLYAEQETNEKLIGEMAERYAQIDYDLIDEFNMRISDCILEGRLAEADSLLRSKGDIKDRIAAVHKAEAIEAAETAELAERQQRLAESKAGTQASKEDITQDCYHFYEKFKLEHNNDSAAYYLEQRVRLDSTNVTWLAAAGDFAKDYLADYPHAMDYYKSALAIAQKGEDAEAEAQLYNNIGIINRLLGQYDIAMDNHLKALSICEKSLGEEHKVTASTHNEIGLLLKTEGDTPQALEHYLKALSIEEKVLGTESLEVATSYNNLGALYYSCGFMAKAMEYYNKALAIREKKLDPDHPELANTYSNIGSLYNSTGDYTRALYFFNRALSIRKEVLGDGHPDVAQTINNIGLAYLGLSDYDNALESYTTALSIYENLLGYNHPDVVFCYHNIGLVHERKKEFGKALEWYNRALEIKQQILGDSHPSTIKTLENIGMIYYSQQDYAHAQQCFAQALTARETAQSDDKAGLADTYDYMGLALSKRGETSQSLEYLLKSAALREQMDTNGNLATAKTYNSIANTYYRLADYGSALQYYQKAHDMMLSLQGENNPVVIDLKKYILLTQYLQALSTGKLKSFLANHCITATVKANGYAETQGLSGEYILLEFADWRPDSETSIFDRATELKESPKDLLLMKDGVISRHHFENKLGFTFGVKQVTREEQQKIHQSYKQWKAQNSQ